MRHTTEYLYNIAPTSFMDLPYKDALMVKKLAAHKLVGELLEVPHIERDDERFIAAYNAVRFNEKLLEELQA